MYQFVPRSLLVVLIPFIYASVAVSQTSDEMRTATAAERAATAAYRAKDHAEFLSQMEVANKARPNHPRLIYNQAVAYALNGRTNEALASLDRLTKMGLAFDLEKDEALKSLAADDRFKKVLIANAGNRAPKNVSTRAFEIADKTLIAESVAYDPKSRAFFVGSVHRRKIVRVDAKGSTRDFSLESDGLWSVLGMKIDTLRGHLWAATAAFPQMHGFAADDKGRSGIFKYDLRSGKLLKEYLLPAGENHVLGDLVIDAAGNVLATDSVSPNIYRVDTAKDEIAVLLSSDLFVSLQGIAFGFDENELFVADYSKGIFRIDLRTKRIQQMKPDENATLLGIDGLYYYRGRLIAIQNGVSPHRVAEFRLNGERIDSQRVIEANHADFMEPTLGVLVKDDFYFVANSQWPLVNEKAELQTEKLRDPIVLRIDLKKQLLK